MNFLIDEGNGALLTDDTLAGERFRLALERIREMETEEETDPAYVPYFRDAAGWVLLLLEHRRMLEDGTFETMPLPTALFTWIYCLNTTTGAGPIRSMQ